MNQTGTYIFGSTEGNRNGVLNVGGNNSASIPPGKPNGSWEKTGSFTTMLQAFADHAVDNPPAKPYTRYRCEPTPMSDVPAASAAIVQVKAAGYCVVGNNCMDHAIQILSAYGATDLPAAGGGQVEQPPANGLG